MSGLSVEPPFPAFADADGQPLDDGYINVGVVNLPQSLDARVQYLQSAIQAGRQFEQENEQ